MAITQKNRDIPLAMSPEPRFQTVQDTVKKKPMTYAEKRAAQEIVKQRNIKARDSVLNRNAAAKGMTREEVRAQQKKDAKKPDAIKADLTDCTKRTEKKGSCTTGNTGGGQSTKDNR